MMTRKRRKIYLGKHPFQSRINKWIQVDTIINKTQRENFKQGRRQYNTFQKTFVDMQFSVAWEHKTYLSITLILLLSNDLPAQFGPRHCHLPLHHHHHHHFIQSRRVIGFHFPFFFLFLFRLEHCHLPLKTHNNQSRVVLGINFPFLFIFFISPRTSWTSTSSNIVKSIASCVTSFSLLLLLLLVLLTF
jgi:hypothetical protein